jgi:diguanylate cyclase (GGDEF)-like protein
MRTVRHAVTGAVIPAEQIVFPDKQGAAPLSERSSSDISPTPPSSGSVEESRAEDGTEYAAAPGANALPSPSQLVRDLVHRAMPEGTQVQRYDGLRCRLDAEGVLQHQCAAWLPGDMVRQKLQGFLRQWQTRVVRWADEDLLVHVSLNTRWWQWLTGMQSTIEVRIRMRRPVPERAQFSEIMMRLRCRGVRQEKSRQVLEQVGPALLHSLRGYLLATAEHRVHERFPFVQPVRVAPVADESLAIDCLGQDISLGGIRFHSPTRPDTSKICLFLPVPSGATENVVSVAVSADVRQVLPDGHGSYLVGAHFEFGPALQNRCVLLIEDDPDETGRLQRMLAAATGLRWELKQVNDLADGLQVLDAGRVDVVLLDLSLGQEALCRVRTAAPAVPVVLLAGPGQGPLALQAVQEGAADYLYKPQLDGNLLGRTLHGAVERQRSKQRHENNERQSVLADRGRQKDHYLAYHDALLGLPNRALFYDRLRQALAEAGNTASQVAVMFLDLDDFKRINDAMGHEAGDRLLQAVAGRLKGCVRKSDTVARLGGDEFTIILTNQIQPQAAALVAEKILKVVIRPLVVDGQEMFITTSIGISVFPSDGMDLETLVKRADLAMYRAKGLGKNTYQLYHRSMDATCAEALAPASDLRKVLDKGAPVDHQPDCQHVGQRRG